MTDSAFILEPRDLLFLKDARPMAASDAGAAAPQVPVHLVDARGEQVHLGEHR